MPLEIFLAAVLLAIIMFVASDFFRTSSDSPLEHAGEAAHDAAPQTLVKPRALATAFLPPPGRSGGAGHAFDAGLPGPPKRIAPPPGVRPHHQDGPAPPRRGSHGAPQRWLVRTRLALLAMVPAIAAALVTAGVIRAAGAFRSASFHSNVGSVRDGAMASALVACVFSVAVLAVGVACANILISSVLRPLRTLQAGAVELAEVRLPDALRRISRSGGEGLGEVEAMAVSSPDEIGEVARAFDQIQGEVLRLAANEAALRGKLDEMFVDLSCRSQSLVERQIRVIDELEQAEQDSERLAKLFKLDHIATRMRRYSENLLVLAGRELPGRWNEPVPLANVIRAAVSEIEEYERVLFSAQPGIAVSGPAAGDVVHLIAELAENATSLSAADTPVDISGRTLASGGVLVDVTDQGVGMKPDEMAQANWRLDNPSATDIAVYRNMGLFVVGRLAARHGIMVRLQAAKSGGLTALVWLPDAVVVLQATAPGRPAGADPDRVFAEREASARSLRPAPVPADVAVRQRPDFRPRPPAPDQALTAAPDQALTPAPDQALTAAPDQALTAAPDQALTAAPEASPADQRRLPIYEAVESDWFRNHRKQFGATAAAEGSWAAPVDAGWHTAKAVTAPSSSGATMAGLPVRVPRANLVPGAISGPPPAAPTPARSASAARNRLAGFQRGTSEGRAAAGATADPGEEDPTS
jgi:signal transduction histidine kinase